MNHIILLEAAALFHASLFAKWLNDPEVVRFTRHVAGEATVDGEEQFIFDCHTNNDILRVITLANGFRPIGNILATHPHPLHKTVNMSLLIGEKDCWGKGYATEAIKQMCKLVFDTTDANKIKAGMLLKNIGSYKAFEKCGFREEGLLKKELYSPNLLDKEGKTTYHAVVLVGLTRREWDFLSKRGDFREKEAGK